MKAVVLVGGEGSRLRPLTLDTPKQMLSVVGMTMLERVLDHLYVHGIDEVVLSLGYRPDVFLNAYPDGIARGVKMKYAVESSPLDTAGAIRFAVDEAGFHETVVVVNGDVLSDIDITELVEFHRSKSAEATISLVPVDNPSAFGVVPCDQDGRVMAFIEKPPRDQAPTNMINAGVYVLEPSAIARVTPGEQVSIERWLFPKLVEAKSLYAKPSDAYWIDAGTPESLLRASMDILYGKRADSGRSGAVATANSSSNAEFGDSLATWCFIAEGSAVAESAVLRSSVVEKGAVIFADCIISSSVIMAGAHIGAGSVIEDSIIGKDVIVPQGAMVLGGSVVARFAELEPGCRIVGERVPA